VPRIRLWGLYERGHCQARFLGSLSLSSILLFDLESLFFRPDLTSAERGAQDPVKDGA
jgi:hypothetical protein